MATRVGRQHPHAAAWFLAVLTLSTALAGCLSSGSDGATGTADEPLDALTPSPDAQSSLVSSEAAAPATEASDLAVRAAARHGHMTGNVIGASGPVAIEVERLEDGRVVASTQAASSGSWEVGFLEPAVEYLVTATERESDRVAQVAVRTSALPWAWAAPEEAVVAPGADTFSCPLGFLLRDARFEVVYALMAGHCVDDDEEIRIFTAGATLVIGSVVDRRDTDAHEDWALVRLEADVLGLANPQALHWTGPSRLVEASAVETGDAACWRGKGTPFSFRPETQHRCGTISSFARGTSHEQDEGMWLWAAVWQGDSGSPLIHHETGMALGVLISGVNGALVYAYSMCTAMHWLHEAGWRLQLLTAAYQPMPEDPRVPPTSGSGSLSCVWP